MKLVMKDKHCENVDGVRHYYCVIECNGKNIKVNISKKQFNRTAIGERIEIPRCCLNK